MDVLYGNEISKNVYEAGYWESYRGGSEVGFEEGLKIH